MVIRFYDSPTTVIDQCRCEECTDVCPDCDGSGQIVLTRLFGRYVEAPYRTTTCTACSGTGEVSADAVVHCVECQAPIWVDRVCLHQLGVVCVDHATPCVECTGVRGDR